MSMILLPDQSGEAMLMILLVHPGRMARQRDADDSRTILEGWQDITMLMRPLATLEGWQDVTMLMRPLATLEEW